jgi:exodeoxyribonuclease VII small subunit
LGVFEQVAKSESSPERAELPCFEDALAQLGEIVHELEEGQIGLSQCLARYEEGVRLLKQCYSLLEHAERRIELLSGVDAAGNAQTQPFDHPSGESLEEKGQSRGGRRSKATPVVRPKSPSSEIDEPPALF